MEEKTGWLGRFLRELLKVVLGVAFGAALLGGLACGLPIYLNWRAQNKAQAFCEGVKRGTDIAPLVAGFEKAAGDQRMLHYESVDGGSHTFLFEGFVFDVVECHITLNKNRKAMAGRVALRQ